MRTLTSVPPHSLSSLRLTFGLCLALATLTLIGALNMPLSPGGALIQHQRLQASDAAAFDNFGFSVAVSGDTAIVGSFADDNSGGPDAGSAYVYTRSGTTWTQQARLQASDAAPFDNFGLRVAIDGDTAVVGAYGDDNSGGANAGSAYVFTRSGGAWAQQARLQASDAAAGDNFGVSVAVDGDTTVVGAFSDDNSGGENVGSAYVFVRSGTTWTQQQRLEASEADTLDNFSVTVGVSGDTAVVGASNDDNSGGANAGSAYVFTRSGGVWAQQARLQASDAAAQDQFGFAVAVSGDTVIAGSHGDDNSGGVGAGSAYVFTRNGAAWTEQQKLLAGDAAPGDDFGISVAVDGDTAVISSDTDDNSGGTDAGSAYVFTRSGTTWIQQQRLQAGDAVANEYFGKAVAVDGDVVIVGSPNDQNSGGQEAGSAFVYGPGVDMEIIKKDSADPVPVGSTFTYTLRVYNRGPLEAHGVSVIDPVPPGLVITGVETGDASDFTGAGCTFDPDTNTVDCDLGTMRVFDNTFDGPVKKGKAVITITATAALAGQYTNEAAVTADEGDLDMSDNVGRQKTTVLGVSSVAVTPNAAPGGANCQKPVVTVTLTGPAPYDMFVALSDNVAATTNIPASSSPLMLRIPKGRTAETLVVETAEVGAAQTGQVTASFGTSAGAPLTVRPIGVRWITVSPESVVGGAESATATVNLECLPAGSVAVTLKSSKPPAAKFVDPAAGMAANPVTVLMAAKQSTFTVETYGVGAKVGVNLSATAGGTTRNARLDVTPPPP